MFIGLVIDSVYVLFHVRFALDLSGGADRPRMNRLYGIMTFQTYYFFNSDERDRLGLRLLVRTRRFPRLEERLNSSNRSCSCGQSAVPRSSSVPHTEPVGAQGV